MPSSLRFLESSLAGTALSALPLLAATSAPQDARRISADGRSLPVIGNLPFPEGALFRHVRRRALPDEAAEMGCNGWARMFLRWILAHPTMIRAIPASSKIERLEDNMVAGIGSLPGFDEQHALARMADL